MLTKLFGHVFSSEYFSEPILQGDMVTFRDKIYFQDSHLTTMVCKDTSKFEI